MITKHGDQPAFPTQDDNQYAQGLTKREYIAAKIFAAAMGSMIANAAANDPGRDNYDAFLNQAEHAAGDAAYCAGMLIKDLINPDNDYD